MCSSFWPSHTAKYIGSPMVFKHTKEAWALWQAPGVQHLWGWGRRAVSLRFVWVTFWESAPPSIYMHACYIKCILNIKVISTIQRKGRGKDTHCSKWSKELLAGSLRKHTGKKIMRKGDHWYRQCVTRISKLI